MAIDVIPGYGYVLSGYERVSEHTRRHNTTRHAHADVSQNGMDGGNNTHNNNNRTLLAARQKATVDTDGRSFFS